jgi:hypothetical protein
MARMTAPRFAPLAVLLALAACGSDSTVSSTDSAKQAYLGLDRAIDKSINLGMAGYNAASSANIPPQTGAGDVNGTLTVSGHVDQGTSNNKEMNLTTAFAGYQDNLPIAADGGTVVKSGITYDTNPASLPALSMSLKGIPTGTFSGTLTGPLTMTGSLKGTITLSLSFAGNLESAGGQMIRRAVGSTHVTGTATSDYGTYTIDLTR